MNLIFLTAQSSYKYYERANFPSRGCSSVHHQVQYTFVRTAIPCFHTSLVLSLDKRYDLKQEYVFPTPVSWLAYRIFARHEKTGTVRQIGLTDCFLSAHLLRGPPSA